MLTIHRCPDRHKAEKVLRGLGFGVSDAKRYVKYADDMGSWNCGVINGKRPVVRKTRDRYRIDVYS